MAKELAVGRGGIGTSGMFIVCGVILAIFAVGYIAMAQHITRVGGLYLFVIEGLGRPLGIGTALTAILTYLAAATGSVGAFAVFAQGAALDLVGWDTPWQLWAFFAVALMATLGLLRVELNARILGVVILLEIAILVITSLAVTIRGGAEGLSGAGFSPQDVFGSNPGAMLAITIAAFAGFEATVIFSEEVRDQKRTIRRATYGAIAVMVVLYAFVSWSIVQAFGNEGAVVEANTDPVGMFFTAAQTFTATWAADLMELLVCTSWMAAILAFHNAASRYVFALGRDRVLPQVFGRSHPRLGSPWTASLGLSTVTLALVLVFVLGKRDPFLDLYVLCSTPGVIGLPVMEAIAAVGIFRYFMRDRRGFSVWRVAVCPLISAAGLAFLAFLIVDQVELFTARTGAINVILPLVVLGTILLGVLRAAWLRSTNPEVYLALGQTDPVA